LIINISLLYFMATILTEMRPLRKLLKIHEKSSQQRILLGLIFGLLSISGTYTGFNFQGAVVNTRVISTVAAGLVGGPIAGVVAGLIGGIHRYFFNPEGFSSLACGIGTFFFGVIGALSYRRYTRSKNKSITLVSLVVLSELLQAIIILAIVKPFEDAVALERAIFLPKILISSVGLLLFMRTLSRMYHNVSIELVEQQSLALLIAQECLPFLREGLDHPVAMQKVTDTVCRMLPEYGVLLTDRVGVVASSGFEGL
jgi:two-component system sensor histidine kinase LytS